MNLNLNNGNAFDYIRYDYFSLSVFFVLSILISVLLLVLSKLLATSKPNYQKISGYECGFEPFSSGNSYFNIHFFIVGILFLIFDLEIILLLPWAICAHFLGLYGFINLIIFLTILVVGLVYEWCMGALNW